MSVLPKTLVILVSGLLIHSINGNGLHKLKSTDALRFKRHDYYGSRSHNFFPTFGYDHPRTWGNNDFSSYNHQHPIEWGHDGHTSYQSYHPAERQNNDYTYNQNNPTILRNEDFIKYTDYTGAWGSFDITESNGKILDRQLFPEDPSSLEPQVNPSTSEVLPTAVTATPTRRISEQICDEYRKNRTAREDYYNKIGQYTYVIGGRFTKPGEFPHMGAVGWKAIKGTWIFICGSSLISTKFLLTAGHCSKVSKRYPNVANSSPEIVRLGDRSIADRTKEKIAYDIKIRRVIVHPQYAPPKKYFDIAIIELMDDAFIDKSVHPACLWTDRDISPLGSKATVTGWGVIETATAKTIPDLQAADVDILSSDLCDDLLRPLCTRLWCGMSESQICAGILKGGVDACQGDSGGPLQVKINSITETDGAMHYLIGITSFGNGCAQANTPAVYTRISSFIDWIENIVWGSTT